jgi:hypothetical protein
MLMSTLMMASDTKSSFSITMMNVPSPIANKYSAMDLFEQAWQ